MDFPIFASISVGVDSATLGRRTKEHSTSVHRDQRGTESPWRAGPEGRREEGRRQPLLEGSRVETQLHLQAALRCPAEQAGRLLRQLPPGEVRPRDLPLHRRHDSEGVHSGHGSRRLPDLHPLLHPHWPHLLLPAEPAVAGAHRGRHRQALGHVQRNRREAGAGPRVPPRDGHQADCLS